MTKREVIAVYCSPEEKELIKQQADEERRSMGGYLLQSAIEKIRTNKGGEK